MLLIATSSNSSAPTAAAALHEETLNSLDSAATALTAAAATATAAAATAAPTTAAATAPTAAAAATNKVCKLAVHEMHVGRGARDSKNEALKVEGNCWPRIAATHARLSTTQTLNPKP